MPTRQPLRSGRRIADGKIAAGRHQGAVDADSRQGGERFVRCVAFGDASEVQAHAFLIERDRSGSGVEVEFAIPRALQGVAERVRRGKAMLLPGLSP